MKLAEKIRDLKSKIFDDSIKKRSTFYFDQDHSLFALLRAYNMIKNGKDSIKRYKSIHYFYRDLNLPFNAFKDLVVGLSKCVFFPIFIRIPYIIFIFLHEKNINEEQRIGWDTSSGLLKNTYGVFIDGLTQVIQGIVHLLLSPYILFLRIPYRTYLTYTQGWQQIGENNGMRDLQSTILDALNKRDIKVVDILDLMYRVDEKHQKAYKNKQIPRNFRNENLCKDIDSFVDALPRSLNNIEHKFTDCPRPHTSNRNRHVLFKTDSNERPWCSPILRHNLAGYPFSFLDITESKFDNWCFFNKNIVKSLNGAILPDLYAKAPEELKEKARSITTEICRLGTP